MELASVGWDDWTPQRVLLGLFLWTLFWLLAVYWAVTRLGAVQAVLAVVAQRAIKRVEAADASGGPGSGGPAAKATCRRTPAGVEVADLRLDVARLAEDNLSRLFFTVREASVGALQLELPGWRSPLVLRARRVRLVLQQRNMPEYVDAETLAKAAAAAAAEVRRQKLDILERLLWATDFGDGAVGAPPQAAAGRRERWAAAMLHRILGIAVQRAEVHIADVAVTYFQEGEPGPHPSEEGRLAGRDAVTMRLRTLDLQPQGVTAASQQHGSPSHPSSRPTSASSSSSGGGDSGNGRGVRSQFAAPQQQAWSVLQLFGWRQAAMAARGVREPLSTRLQIAGVSLSLATWRILPPGDDAVDSTGGTTQHTSAASAVSPAQGSAAGHAAHAAGPAAQQAAGGGSSGARLPAWQRQQREHTGEASRRKRLLEAAGLAPADGAQPRGRQQNEISPQGPPAAEYLLLQQWGAEVALTVLPPGRRPDALADAQAAAPETAAGSGQGSGRGGVKTPSLGADAGGGNSSVPSSPASFRSWSIPAGNGATNGHHTPQRPDSSAAASDQQRPPSGGAAQRAAQSGTAKLPGGSPTLNVVASLRACVLTAGAPELAVGLRLLQTFQDYARSHRHWRSRPQMPVATDPAAWWRHAISAVRDECHAVRRQQAALGQLVPRRQARRQYQALYAASRTGVPAFKEPDLRWWQRRRVAPADAGVLAELRHLEAQLTVEQVSHFRMGVAAIYSANLAGSPRALHRASIGVDAIIASHGVPSDQALAMLFAHPRVPKAVPPPPVLLRLTASLPKAGLSVQLGPACEDRNLDRLDALLTGAVFTLAEDNEVVLAVDALSVSNARNAAPSRDLPPLLVSPSREAGDYSHVARSYIGLAESSAAAQPPQQPPPPPLHPGGPPFLDMRMQMSPQRLTQMPAAKESGQGGARSDVTQRRPAHQLLNGAVAGVCINYEPATINAAVDFYTHVVDYIAESDRLNGTAFSNASLDTDGASSPLTGSGNAQLEGIPKLVTQTFARHGIPLAAPLAPPILNMSITCPAIVARFPYTYDDAVMRTDGAPTPAPFEALVVLSDVQASIFGDEFWQFVECGGNGALQRCSVGLWLDIVFAQRPSAEQQQVLDDAALHGLRRVWANPEDVLTFFQERAETAFSSMSSAHLGLQRPSFSLLRISTTGPASAQRTAPPRFARISEDADPHHPGSRGGLLPLVPVLRLAGLRAEGASRTAPLPAPPGNASLGLAVSAVGLQVWLSPYQVAHGVALAETIAATLPRLRAAPLPPPAAAVAAEAAKEAVPDVVSTLAIMKRRQRLLISAEIPLVSILAMVANPAGADEQASQSGPQASHNWRQRSSSRRWQPAPDAGGWSQSVLPVYSISVVAARAMCKYKGTGEISAGFMVDGLMARDLTCPPSAKHAYILRPLPTRADRLQAFAETQRAATLRYTAPSPVACR